MSRSPYLSLEMRIAADERGGITHRWRYGRRLLDAKAGRKQLPHGLSAELVAAADRAGLKLSEREIQYRLKCAEVYATETEVRTACADFGSWSALREAGFPPVEIDQQPELDLDDLDSSAPDSWQQPTLIPGFGETIKAHGREVPIDEATVGDVAAYRDMWVQIHENYGKKLALIEAALEAMREGSDGDDDANAVEAWKRGTS